LPRRPPSLGARLGGNRISHIMTLFGIAFRASRLIFLDRLAGSSTPVSDALIMPGQLP
jgi:hypothetical protein